MKIINRMLGIAALVLLMSFSASAQSKIGHINAAEVLQEMAAWKAAEKQMETFQAQIEAQLKGRYESYQTKSNAFLTDRQNGLLTPRDEETRLQEIQQMEVDIQKEEQEAQTKILQKRQELIEPITTKLKNVIDQVAAENGYNYVFDTSTGAFLYTAPSDDITALVKARL